MKRLSLMAVIGALSLALIVPSTVAAAPQRNALLTDVPVTGTLAGGTFAGVLSVTDVALNSAGDLVVGGVLDGTATVGGVVTQIVDQAFEVTADLTGAGGGTQGKCDILFLDLGPIHLDLLGLEVDLSQITLDVNAIPGAGNLLGNLLCAVAGLLDGGPLAGLNALLNRITGLLGGLLG